MPTIVDVGLNRTAQSVVDSISHVAVGIGMAPESEGDTRLETELYRKAPDSKSIAGNVLTVRTFFPNAVLPVEIYEIGMFIDGSGIIDSGILLGRWRGTIIKSGNDVTLWLFLEVDRA